MSKREASRCMQYGHYQYSRFRLNSTWGWWAHEIEEEKKDSTRLLGGLLNRAKQFGPVRAEAPHLANEVPNCLHTTHSPHPTPHYEMFYSWK